MVNVSDLPMQVFKSEPITFQLRIMIEKHVFLLVKCAPVHLIRWDLLEAYSEMLLELKNLDADQNLATENWWL